MSKAFDEVIRINRRRPRAMQLTAMVMDVLTPTLDRYREDNLYREVSKKLMDLFSAVGGEVITDMDREQYGLPPRGPDGLTAEELLKIEQARLDALYRPMSHTINLTPIEHP